MPKLLSVLLLLGSCSLAAAQALPTPSVLRVDAGRADAGHAAVSDAAGRLYVAGTVEAGGQPTRFAVVKYDPQGNQLWRAHADGSLGGPQGEARSVAVDRQGNVYATGRVLTTSGTSTLVQGLLVCFSADGSRRWTRALGVGDIGVRVLVDSADRAIVSTVSGLTAQYDAAGNLLWSQRFAGPAPTDALTVTDMRLDASGGIVVTGFGAMSSGLNGAHDIVTLRYSPQGALLWQSVYSDTAASTERPSAIAPAVDGSIYVTGVGSVDVSGELPDVPLLLKYDASSGAVRLLGISPAFGGEAAAVGAGGDVTVAGNGVVSRFDALGAMRWSLALPDMAGARTLALGQAGEAYVSGSLITTRVSATGQVEGRFEFNDGQRSRRSTAALVLAPNGVLLAAGSTASPLTSIDADMLSLRFELGSGGSGLPAAPSGLSARASSGAITLGWTDNAGNESSYRIERCTGNCSSFLPLAELAANTSSFVDRNVQRGTSYSYRVKAHNAVGDSAPSNGVTVKAR